MRMQTDVRKHGSMVVVSNSNNVADALCKALDLDPNRVARLVLDMQPFQPVVAYVQMFGDDRLEGLDLEEFINQVKEDNS